MRPKSLLSFHLGLLALLATSTACVSQGKYDAAVQEAADLRGALARSSEEHSKEAANSKKVLEDLDCRCAGRTLRLAEAEGKSAELTQHLAATRSELEEVRRQKLAMERRAEMFRDVAKRLKAQVDTGQLSVSVRDGRIVLSLPNDVLFDTGRTEIKPKGKEALRAVASAIKTISGRHFQVAGHTDTVPIHTDRFPSNWELSSGRALEVVHLLVHEGIEPGVLSAAGYGEVDPVAPNDTAANKQRNRRTEITLLPNIDELVLLPER